ncbi:MAG: hypothetical protein IJY42_04285, partial [Clostridia bacterium]|nr:hypothetical protein [Clostridia bacterium]
MKCLVAGTVRLLCLLLVCLLMGSCAQREERAEDTLQQILSLLGEYPTGVTYRFHAEEGMEDYLSEA